MTAAHALPRMDQHLMPDWAHAALVTIDVQQDYAREGAPLNAPGASAALPGIERLTRAFRDAGMPIVHVVRLYQETDEVDLPRRALVTGDTPVLRPGTEGADLVAEVKPSGAIRLDAERLMNGCFQTIGPNEWVMYKPRWGAFYRTRLEHHLKDLGVNTIVLCGSSFANGTRATVYQASERDFRIVLATDAVTGFYDQGGAELAQIGVALMSADACAACLG
jgi:nicotinamidase-related amidase